MNGPDDQIRSPVQGKGASLPLRAILFLRDPMHPAASAARHLATARRSECKFMASITIKNPEPYRDVSTVCEETVWGSMDEVYLDLNPSLEQLKMGGKTVIS